MPIIKVERKQTKTQIKAAIENDIQERLRAYCRFSGATNDQVVTSALKFLFQSDGEFGPWYEAHKDDAQPPRRNTMLRAITRSNCGKRPGPNRRLVVREFC